MSNNAITGFTPIWEGKINDGGFQPKELLKQANKDMDTKWKAAKPKPKYICKLTAKGQSVALQFTDPTGERLRSPQGCGCRLTNAGVLDAAKKANLVTQAIQTETFSWDWFESTIQKKKLTTKEKQRQKEEKEKEEENKPVGELFAAYKKQWFEEDKLSNTPKKNPEKAWYEACRWLEKVFINNEENYQRKISKNLILECIEKTKKNSETRLRTLLSLKNFLDWCGKWNEYSKLVEKYQTENKPAKQKKYTPNDNEIEYIFENGFTPSEKCRRDRLSCYPKWQFLYALLAVYGIRVHEAWHIKNWNEPVVMGKDDWIEIEEFTDNDKDIESDNVKAQKLQLRGKTVIPAIFDENNKNKFLAIGHETKTGYRLAMPISPKGKDWFERFGLNQPFNLPDIKNPLDYANKGKGAYNCANRTGDWFRDHQYGFTAHALRHACNHRGHGMGINASVLSQSLGHSIRMNTTTYHDTMPVERKMNNMVSSLKRVKEEDSETEKLKEENEQLKKKVVQLETAIQFKDEEIERLRTELKMIKAIEN